MVLLLSLCHPRHLQPSRRRLGVADAETATLFKPLFDDAAAKHNIMPGQLTLHADRGSPMKAKATAFLLADLGVTRSHNRPHTSNDNPFSESHFKTLKYQPRFPKRFGCIEDAKTFCRSFFDWYNQDHHHSGIGLMTPDQYTSARSTRFTPHARSPSIRRSAQIPSGSSKTRPFHPPNQPQHGSTRQRRNHPPECYASPLRPSDRPVPFLRHHCVTRIHSLHRLPLFAAWSGSTAIRHVTLCGTQARQTARPWPEAKKPQSH